MINGAPEIRYLSNDVFCSTVQQMLEEGLKVEFTVTGNSMWPLLKSGRDKVTLTLCDPDNIKKGDVILFEAMPSKYLLHRVTRICEKTFDTTGDFNSFRDGSFPLECVIGKAVSITRKGKCHEMDSFFMKLYSVCWIRLFAVRRPLLKLLGFLAAVKK